MKLTKEQRSQLVARLNELDDSVKHGRWSNEALMEKLAELVDDEGKLTMSEILSKYRAGYAVSVTPNGRKSRFNGDDVAEVLVGVDADQIIAAAEKLCGLKKGELAEKYAGMNNGQRRMNAGNRIRGAFKRGEVTVDEIQKAVFH